MIPVSDIAVRSVSGFLFAVPALAVYFLCLKWAGKRQRSLRMIATFVFCYYLFGVLTVTGIGYTPLRRFSPSFALIPFLDMIAGPVDTALNVILFVPFGLFLPLLYRKYRNVGRAALAGFLFSLAIELVQMFDWGSTDINDLICNTAGAYIGYLLYRLVFGNIKNASKAKLQACKVNDSAEVTLFILYAFAVMVTAQPWVIHELLHIA